MTHPLASLIASRPANPMASRPTTPAPTTAHLADSSRGGAWRSVAERGGNGSAEEHAVEQNPPALQSMPLPGLALDADFAILAVRDPAGVDGRPGAIHFGPNLSLAERREIVAAMDWFDRSDRRRRRREAATATTEDAADDATTNTNP